MRPLSPENIVAELSYAYLHAVASHAAVACVAAGRHEDNAGVDAKLTGWGPFPNGGYRNEVDIKIQLKATAREPAIVGNCLSYSLHGIAQYDDLRTAAVCTPRILVVLFLPPTHAEWLSHSDKALSLRKCAYWVSLRGAPASENRSTQTVYLPTSQRFDPAGLVALMARLSRNDIPLYQGAEA
ncbi:hypothetical protein CAL12_03110 [Bordetella genomosp. 8]|uniref:DUF4365 domain-containing protein n=1 Tax=Bordetella genomosp. 8 TaxID=1416806 RepID=A0A1W6YFW3_9BORD|nr:hypothetical protein CAL12_03110 [Bordetella genomosp. 8]